MKKGARIPVKGARRKKLMRVMKFPFGPIRMDLCVRESRCRGCLLKALEWHARGISRMEVDGLIHDFPLQEEQMKRGRSKLTVHQDHQGRGFYIQTTGGKPVTYFGRTRRIQVNPPATEPPALAEGGAG